MVNIKDIISLHSLPVDTFEELKSGYSSAKKYKLYSVGCKPLYLLKIYTIEKRDRVEREFELLNKHYKNNVLCQKPIIFDFKKEEKICYVVLSYIDGTSGDTALATLGKDLQYEIGLQAGKELRKIHLITPDNSFNWYKKRLDKYQNKIETCKRIGLTFYKQKFIESYINENINLLKNSPICFQHDDFHPQNIIIKNKKLNGIIDFDSFDWGDPFEEFFKLPKYTIQTSTYFAKGQIMGYFDNKIPDIFWRKYNLFVALNQHASQIGGYSMGNLKYVQERTRYIIETHDFLNNKPPEWFDNCNF
ncbi:aminoglycoside phosphotransferase (APT) family kinase protein [Bacillus pakistanensis]|uniref:Aminoglycoside phosphotransferase (APT) family kinase protein n=1 Tax=Rossellomorea pakistanensis TaxID=992288 RepID=A0ABS2NCT4_9BACI|nr:aminoglycoside phosphotransferase family protein [Bacillus pakistanensis]MBM7585658.1 aminoglycoside phosphotransferase (APT) family kinase protein [Bacillus pakistanensis]